MTNSEIGIVKRAAARIGISYEDYITKVEDGLKWCTGCKAWHSTSDFSRDKSRYDGLSSKCDAALRQVYRDNQDTLRKKSNENYADNREAAIIRARKYYAANRTKVRERSAVLIRDRKIKTVSVLGGRCARCGFDEHPAALQFHHRDPTTKLFAVSTSTSNPNKYTWDEVLEEVAKCDLLCANCHFIVECTWVLDDNIWPRKD